MISALMDINDQVSIVSSWDNLAIEKRYRHLQKDSLLAPALICTTRDALYLS